MRLKQRCLQVKEFSGEKMSVKICNMIDKCNCGKADCCMISNGEENGA